MTLDYSKIELCL